ncbi:hypothetical protein ACJX0J_025885, partial [Zea mays]
MRILFIFPRHATVAKNVKNKVFSIGLVSDYPSVIACDIAHFARRFLGGSFPSLIVHITISALLIFYEPALVTHFLDNDKSLIVLPSLYQMDLLFFYYYSVFALCVLLELIIFWHQYIYRYIPTALALVFTFGDEHMHYTSPVLVICRFCELPQSLSQDIFIDMLKNLKFLFHEKSSSPENKT